MTDATKSGFDEVWARVPNRRELEMTATLVTVGHAGPTATVAPVLPRVDALLTLGDVLGFGANGEVVSARQTSLERTIAVKRPLDRESTTVSSRLLREARIIGYLEHPNIPPVHFVGATDAEELLVGLKRIEGDTLTTRLEREHPLDNLDDNLDVLIHVCNAVGFAHSRGVLHLDIKPDNIMTGHYGEVYLLDWGLAMKYGAADVPGVENLPATQGVRGTPAFIAPESIINEEPTPRTDVYLLGGVLHYILTHAPPNAGTTAIEAMQDAYEGVTPDFADAVPKPLADICRKALARDPRDRFRDADEFRTALVDYRRVLREIEAITVAKRQVAELARALAEGDEPSVTYQRYGAARQAIDEAARLQTAEQQTRPLLQAILEPMIEWELGRENLGGAELLLAELPDEDRRLSAACEALRNRHGDRAAELSALRSELDPNVGRRSKALFACGIGFTLAAIEVAAYMLGIEPTAARVLAGHSFYAVVLVALSYAMRATVLHTHTNRSITLAIWLLTLFALALRIGAYLGALSLAATISYDLILVCLIDAYTGLVHDRRLLVGLPVYMLAAAATFLAPDLVLVIFGMAHFVGLSVIALSLTYRQKPTGATV